MKKLVKKNLIIQKINSYFKIDTLSSTIKKEIVGGLTTFLAICYILAVNPSLVSQANGAANYVGGLFLATALSSFIGTMLMGLFAKIPIALAPGMGLNAFFAFTIANQPSIGFGSALTITILSGLCYLIVVLTPIREKLTKIFPTNVKLVIGISIGFFIAFLGLEQAHIIVPADPNSGLATKLGDFSNPLVILSLVLIVVGFILHYSKIKGALIITMLLGAIILIPICLLNNNIQIELNPSKVGYKGFNTFGEVISKGWEGFANQKMWTSPITYIGILSFLYMDFFDTTGTLIAIDREIKLEKNDPKWMQKANAVDAVATLIGASIGSTTVTSYVESVVGVSSGARSGFSSIVCSLFFVISIALWPVLQIFMPINYANVSYQPITGPILVIVGSMMIIQLRNFEWQILIDIPVLFICIISMMLTNSIAYGISFAVILFVFLNVFVGLIQKIKHKKQMTNSMSISFSNKQIDVKTREFYYLKRLNIGIFITSIIALIYIILQLLIDKNVF